MNKPDFASLTKKRAQTPRNQSLSTGLYDSMPPTHLSKILSLAQSLNPIPKPNKLVIEKIVQKSPFENHLVSLLTMDHHKADHHWKTEF